MFEPPPANPRRHCEAHTVIADRDTIATLIPHAGTMCLLDGLLSWDETTIHCLSRRYQNADNPLRRADGTLGIATGIEIAAQAMALHGGLTAPPGSSPAQGRLASLRDIRFAAASLDGAGDLMVEAQRLLGDSAGATYRFALTRDGATLISGRATVLLHA